VKTNEVIDHLSETYFPFSFYLLEDELQALQLVVDVTTAFLVETPDLIGEVHKLENRVVLYKKVYELSMKRRVQLNIDEREVSLKEKAAFFLSESVGLAHNVIALMLDIEEIELKQLISSARYKVFLKERAVQGSVSASRSI